MFKFKEEVKKSLIQAGWFEGRCIDISEFVGSLEKDSYKILPAVRYFLSEFGGLRIQFISRNGERDNIDFNTSKAVAEIDPIWIKEEYVKRTGSQNLCPIGQAYSNHLTLLMDEKGKVFGGYDDNLYHVADNGQEAIEYIYLNIELIEVLK